MTLLYASTFTKALNRLTAPEQKQVKKGPGGAKPPGEGVSIPDSGGHGSNRCGR